ncbi:MAG: ribosome maturation factor RimM [Alphaproteobacteria bacterium]|nr:ribosome maturation factor RimM [Alphaproteobacteria bacterium]
MVCVGVVTGPHGVTGAVRIKSFTARPEDVAAYGPLGNQSGTRWLELRLLGAAKGVVIGRFSGVDDRNRAEALRGLRLYLPRAVLPPPEEDEYYHADLMGLEAVLMDGTRLGRVRAIHDFGAGDTIEIERQGAAPIIVPFTRAVVPLIDLESGRIVIDPPQGLLEPVKQDPLPPLGGEGRVRGGVAAQVRPDNPLTPALSPKGAREKKVQPV